MIATIWRWLLLAGCVWSGALHAAPPTIAAAADLKFALDEVLAGYRAAGGGEVQATYGSSGNFYTQLRHGAPFAIFMSADESLVQKLAGEGLTRDAGHLYAVGRLVLFAPRGAPFTPDAACDDLRRALAAGRIDKFAIANPEHAPYGRAAQDALTALGVWAALEPHLVRGDNVAQAAQFTLSGAAQGGVFALSLALVPAFTAAGTYVLLPASLHAPLRQRMVLMRGANADAEALYAYLRSPAAQAVFARYGFTVPAD